MPNVTRDRSIRDSMSGKIHVLLFLSAMSVLVAPSDACLGWPDLSIAVNYIDNTGETIAAEDLTE